MPPLRVILADDHPVMRQGLRTLLEQELTCKIVGEAADGLSAIALVAQYLPDVLVVDMMLPALPGLEVIRQVQAQVPATRIVVLSMHADELYVREALRLGATAYVLKESQAHEFVLAVSEAAAGRRYLSQALSERMIDQYIQQGIGSSDPYDLLSERERTVLRLSALGQTAAEVASSLALSPRTIETYRTNLLQKLGLRNQAELIRYALRRGLITLDE